MIAAIFDWISGFIHGFIVRVECHYCPFVLSESDIDSIACKDKGEEALIDAILEHDCHVKTRRMVDLVSRRLGFIEDVHTITKSLWPISEE